MEIRDLIKFLARLAVEQHLNELRAPKENQTSNNEKEASNGNTTKQTNT